MAQIDVRPPTPDERAAIIELVRMAFSTDGRDGAEEVHVVEETWRRAAAGEGLELVAVRDGEVVGHVLGAWGDMAGTAVIGVAPLAVAPEWQGRGIGTVLMAELLARSEEQALPMVVLLGSPAYYGRFGFEPSGPLGIAYKPVGPDNPHFMVRRLSAYNAEVRGDYRYCWELPEA